MKFVLVSLALLAGTTGVAAADGWIDCNGPDKSGHGCSATGDRAAGRSPDRARARPRRRAGHRSVDH